MQKWFSPKKIKFLRENKHCGSKRFLTEFPDKNWSLSALERLLKKINENLIKS